MIAEVADYLSAVADQHVDWVSVLTKDSSLRIFFDARAAAVSHKCQSCCKPMHSLLIMADKVCVDAHYYLQMENGREVFSLTTEDRIVKQASTVNLTVFAANILDVESEFIDRVVYAAGKHGLPINFRVASGQYSNVCPSCNAPQGEILIAANMVGNARTLRPSNSFNLKIVSQLCEA